VTYPKLGTTFYKMSSVAIDGTMITGSTSDVGVYASSETASIILGADYLDSLGTGGHKLDIVFENNDAIEIPITIIDSTKPLPSAKITVAPESSTIYKGKSVTVAAELADLVSIDDDTLEWEVTGGTSSGTRISGSGKTAMLYCGSDEESSSLNVSAKLFYYQNLRAQLQ
jgi:hypothetical protein